MWPPVNEFDTPALDLGSIQTEGLFEFLKCTILPHLKLLSLEIIFKCFPPLCQELQHRLWKDLQREENAESKVFI